MRAATVAIAAATLAAAVAFGAAARRAVAPLAPPAQRAAAESPIPAEYGDPSFFLSPIMQAKGTPADGLVTGITVPHHLLARDLIADAFRFASGAHPRQVLLLSPDHFFLGGTDVSVAERDFDTVFGVLRADREGARALEALPSVRAQDFFYREHGVQAELPFIKRHFPDAAVLAVAFKESTPKAALDEVVAVLEKVLDPDALVVQSTDFSHYLTAAEADARDRQTVAVLQRGEPEDVLALDQPANMDSTAAQYVQSRLQKEYFQASLKILAHRNSQAYAETRVDSTTSYIVQAYVREK